MRYFRIPETRHGTTTQVFVVEDPRKSDYRGVVEEGVTLDYDLLKIHEWPDGAMRPDACLGRDPKDPKHYQVFKYSGDLHSAGFEPVPGTVFVTVRWEDFTRLRTPPDPQSTTDERWFEFLDEVDADSRERRLRMPEPDPPAGASRDDVAAWVARTHLLTDSGIREVWYLPRGAPTGEIRLLELSDRYLQLNRAHAIDFGLDVEGSSYRLLVADVTSELLESIKQDPSQLPDGWTLDGNRIWRRGA